MTRWNTLASMVALFAMLFATASHGAGNSITITPKDIRFIYDGDTYYIYCLAGLKCPKPNQIGVRDLIIDTAELKHPKCPQETKLARAAKKRAVAFLRQAKKLTLEYNPKRKYDTFGRLLARTKNERGEYLDDYMLQRPDLTRIYRKMNKNWCKSE